MKLLTYLMGTNVGSLKTIASRTGHFIPENSKQRLVSSIIQRLSNKENLQTILSDLSDNAHWILKFVLSRPKKEWNQADFVSFEKVWSVTEIQRTLDELVETGLLGKAQGGYFTFEEIDPLLRDCVGQRPAEPVPSVITPSAVYSTENGWITDLVTILTHCMRRQVQLTRKNTIHRRDFRNLHRLLLGEKFRSLHEQFCKSPLPWQDELLADLREIGVIRFQGPRLIGTGDPLNALADWWETNVSELRNPSTPVPEWRFSDADAHEVRRRVLETSPPADVWYPVEDLESSVYPIREIFHHRLPDTVRTTLFFMMFLGVVELGKEGDRWFWRPLSRTAESETFVRVQPNFEIVTAVSLPVRSRCTLEKMADLVSIDHQLLHYRISKDSVYRGLCSGLSAEEQVRWYFEHTGETRPLPQNVQHSIESWGAAYGQVSLERPLLLVCNTPHLAEQIYHTKELTPYCIGRFSENAILLREGTEEEVMQTLKDIGMLPSPEIGGGERWAVELRNVRKRA